MLIFAMARIGMQMQIAHNEYQEKKMTKAEKQQTLPDGWLRAIDEALVVHHVGIADVSDSYESAKDKLNRLLCCAQDIGALHAAQPSEQSSGAAQGERVYLVNTGEIMNGVELYERHDQRPPMADVEVLYTKPAQESPGLDEREAFEAWYYENVNRAEMPDYLPTLNTYSSATVANLFCTWKAARAPLLVRIAELEAELKLLKETKS